MYRMATTIAANILILQLSKNQGQYKVYDKTDCTKQEYPKSTNALNNGNWIEPTHNKQVQQNQKQTCK